MLSFWLRAFYVFIYVFLLDKKNNIVFLLDTNFPHERYLFPDDRYSWDRVQDQLRTDRGVDRASWEWVEPEPQDVDLEAVGATGQAASLPPVDLAARQGLTQL